MSIEEMKQTQIKRKENIDKDVRTPGKDDCADYIESKVIAKGQWPMDMIDIAEESG